MWEPRVERNVAVEEVAVRCGYARMRLLTAHTRRIMGVSPTDLRNHFTRESFGARLSSSLTD